MSNSYYNHATYPTPNSPGSSAALRAELSLITDGFDKLPSLSGNGYKVAMVNAGGTALVASAALQSLAITGSTIDSTPIGATTRAAGNFTNLSVNGTAGLGTSVTIGGGTINNTPIGGTTPSSGAFTTASASSGFTGNLTGNVTGNVSGNVTGNLTGNVTGNVTAASGTSTFNNVTINGTLDMDAASSATIINLPNPSNNGDAANKDYVDTQDALKLSLTGGTMSGAIAMGTSKITGLGTPTASADATTKTYVDSADALKLNLSGGTMSGAIAMGTNKITGLGTPSADADAATKAYVDSVAQGLDVKPSVRAATTANITLSGAQTIDGVSIGAGDRVLVKDQSTAADNGIYVAASGTWARSNDADAWAELPGAFVFVESGTVNDNSGWVCTVAPGGTLGSTAVTFEQFSGAGQITAGAGLTKSGNTIDVGTASASRIAVGPDSIDLATTGVVAGTYKSITVDQWGRATAGTNPTTLSGYGITDAYTITQVDNALALKLNLSGGTMSGNLAMSANRITGLGDPTNAQDAATRNYTDTGLALKLSLTGGTMSGAIAMGTNKITGMGDPTNAQDAATKNYIDTIFGSTASAAASASAAAASQIAAASSATAASGSASAALTSANNAAASYDSFDDRYLGAKSSDPTLDNDGNALLTGALYWNTSASIMKVWTGSAWEAAYLPAAGYLALSGGTMTGPLIVNGSSSSSMVRVTQTGSGPALLVEDSANPDSTPFVIDENGRVLIGDTQQRLSLSTATLEMSSAGNFGAGAPAVALLNYSANASFSSGFSTFRAAGGTIGSPAAVDLNWDLGTLNFYGYDGSSYGLAARVLSEVDGSVSVGSMPGRLSLMTTPSGSTSPVTRMLIDNGGHIGVGGSAVTGYAVRVGKNATGGSAAGSYVAITTVQSDVTAAYDGYSSFVNTAASAFTLTTLRHYRAVQQTIGLGSAVTNQMGFAADSTLIGATNNYGFYSDLAAGTGRWNFYAIGSAANFLAGGVILNNNLGLGSASSPNYGTSGQALLSAGSGAVPTWGTLGIAGGGTGATDAATARTNLGLAIGTNVPSPTGTGASGTWGINITGNAATVTNGLTTSNFSSYALPLTGGTLTGDITTYRAATPSTGVIYLGNSGARYLYYDGTNYQMPGAALYVNGVQAVTNTGTWGINITGNAATVTNGVYTTGSQSITGDKEFAGAVIFGNSGTGRLYANWYADSGARSYFAPRNATNTDWDWNSEFGWDGTNRRWYFDSVPFIGGNPAPIVSNPGNGDLNQVYAPGIYGFESPSANGPGYSYSHLLVMKQRHDTAAQLAIDYNTGNMSVRGAYLPNGNSTAGAVWSAWRSVYHSGTFSYSTGVTANHVVQRDVNGYIYASYINANTGQETGTINSVFFENGDGWIRKMSRANFIANFSGDAADAWGYKGVPINSQSAAYTLVMADQGKAILHPSSDNAARTFTIPANGSVAFPVGTVVTFINKINTVTIAITTDTLTLAGAGTTGSRTLAANGMATAVKITSTEWVISGSGLT